MDGEQDSAEKARQLSTSVYPKHDAMIEALRLERGRHLRKIPKVSVIVQEAIEEKAIRDLGADRVEQVVAGAA